MRLLFLSFFTFLTCLTYSQNVENYLVSQLLIDSSIKFVSLKYSTYEGPYDSTIYNKITKKLCNYGYIKKRKKYKIELSSCDSITSSSHIFFINTKDPILLIGPNTTTKYYYDSNKRLYKMIEKSQPTDQGLEYDSTMFYYDNLNRLSLITTFYLISNRSYRTYWNATIPSENVISYNYQLEYTDSTRNIKSFTNYYLIINDKSKHVDSLTMIEYKDNSIIFDRYNLCGTNDIYCKIRYN